MNVVDRNFLQDTITNTIPQKTTIPPIVQRAQNIIESYTDTFKTCNIFKTKTISKLIAEYTIPPIDEALQQAQNETDLQQVIENYQGLSAPHRLNFQDKSFLTTALLMTFLRKFSDVKELNLIDCRQVDVSKIMTFLSNHKNCKDLKVIRLAHHELEINGWDPLVKVYARGIQVLPGVKIMDVMQEIAHFIFRIIPDLTLLKTFRLSERNLRLLATYMANFWISTEKSSRDVYTRKQIIEKLFFLSTEEGSYSINASLNDENQTFLHVLCDWFYMKDDTVIKVASDFFTYLLQHPHIDLNAIDINKKTPLDLLLDNPDIQKMSWLVALLRGRGAKTYEERQLSISSLIDRLSINKPHDNSN